MKLRMLWVILRPEKAAQVERALEAKGFCALTEMRVYGRGQQRGIQVGSATYDELAKTLLLLAVEEDRCALAIQTIQEAGRTGNPGDGKIFVQAVGQALTVRTGKMEA